MANRLAEKFLSAVQNNYQLNSTTLISRRPGYIRLNSAHPDRLNTIARLARDEYGLRVEHIDSCTLLVRTAAR